MRFEKIVPTEQLQPYIKHYIISENIQEKHYTVFPVSGLVIGFQYQGRLSSIANNTTVWLSSSGITGISDHHKVFKSSAHIGTILVYFTEIGFCHFTANPAHELFNQSISLDYIFEKSKVTETEEKLAAAKTDKQRIQIVEQFFLSQTKQVEIDRLIVEAVKMIYDSKGSIRIRDLHKRLLISESPFEKRFRKWVGTSPKKFASIVRFHTVLASLNGTKSLADICYENNFFDQAHFTKSFKQYTGDTPENFNRFL